MPDYLIKPVTTGTGPAEGCFVMLDVELPASSPLLAADTDYEAYALSPPIAFKTEAVVSEEPPAPTSPGSFSGAVGDGPFTLDLGTLFTGEALVFASDIALAQVNGASLEIADTLSAYQVTITATNSAGQATNTIDVAIGSVTVSEVGNELEADIPQGADFSLEFTSPAMAVEASPFTTDVTGSALNAALFTSPGTVFIQAPVATESEGEIEISPPIGLWSPDQGAEPPLSYTILRDGIPIPEATDIAYEGGLVTYTLSDEDDGANLIVEFSDGSTSVAANPISVLALPDPLPATGYDTFASGDLNSDPSENGYVWALNWQKDYTAEAPITWPTVSATTSGLGSNNPAGLGTFFQLVDTPTPTHGIEARIRINSSNPVNSHFALGVMIQPVVEPNDLMSRRGYFVRFNQENGLVELWRQDGMTAEIMLATTPFTFASGDEIDVIFTAAHTDGDTLLDVVMDGATLITHTDSSGPLTTGVIGLKAKGLTGSTRQEILRIRKV